MLEIIGWVVAGIVGIWFMTVVSLLIILIVVWLGNK